MDLIPVILISFIFDSRYPIVNWLNGLDYDSKKEM